MRAGVCAVVGVLVALACQEAAGAVETLDAGGLRVEVREDPFELRFVDVRDGDVLRTVGASERRIQGCVPRRENLNARGPRPRVSLTPIWVVNRTSDRSSR